jgi:hypothetical protein
MSIVIIALDRDCLFIYGVLRHGRSASDLGQLASD